MRLYFLRHGPALSRSEWTVSDDARPLSTRGEAVVRAVASRIAALELGLEAILTSPYERALHTARLVQDALGGEVPLVEDRGLTPDTFCSDSLEAMLEARRPAQVIMLVGHEPSMSEVLSDIVGGGEFVLKKAGLARVDLYSIAPARGELRWLVPPALLK